MSKMSKAQKPAEATATQETPALIIVIPETNCLRELRRQSKKIKQIQNLLAITKDRKIVDIYSKSR